MNTNGRIPAVNTFQNSLFLFSSFKKCSIAARHLWARLFPRLFHTWSEGSGVQTKCDHASLSMGRRNLRDNTNYAKLNVFKPCKLEGSWKECGHTSNQPPWLLLCPGISPTTAWWDSSCMNLIREKWLGSLPVGFNTRLLMNPCAKRIKERENERGREKEKEKKKKD